MTWLLIIIVIFPDGSATEVPWAQTPDERFCVIAGTGSAEIMARANPDTIVAYRCDLVEPPTS